MRLFTSRRWLAVIVSILLVAILADNANLAAGATIKTETQSISKSTVVLADEDRPEVVSVAEVEKNGHVQRLYDQEKDLNTIVFQNDDGTKTLYYYSEPVKYIDENGEVQDKSSMLTTVTGNVRSTKYGYANEDNDVRTYFPNSITTGTGVLLESEDISIELTPVSTLKSRNADVAKKVQLEDDLCSADEAVSYDKVFGNDTEIRYTPLLNGFKEEIILNSYNGTNEFAFTLKTNGLQMVEADGRWYLADPDTKEYVVSVGELIVYDSSKEVKKDVLEKSVDYDHYYMVETLTANSEYKITAIIDEAYLLSSDTVYPVTVDPSFDIISSNDGIMDIFVDQSGTIYKADGLFAGEIDENQVVYRTFVKFPGLISSWEWAALAPGGYGNDNFPEITKLTLNLYNETNGYAAAPVKTYLYSGQNAVDWSYTASGTSPESFTSANFNAKGDFASSTTIDVVAGWNEINLTNISAFDLSKGIVIQNQYENLYDESVLKVFHSTRNINKPKISVTWQELNHTSFATAKTANLNTRYYAPVLEEDVKYYFSFTPSTTGLYTVESIDIMSGEPCVWLYNSSQVLLEHKESNTQNESFEMTYHLDAGEKYYVVVGCSEIGRYTFKIKTTTDIASIVFNETLTTAQEKITNIGISGEKQFFSFTAPTGGTYRFESSSNEVSNPQGWIYNSSGELLSSNVGNAANDNFSMVCNLNAGQDICLVNGCYDGGTGTFSVAVTQETIEKEISQTLNAGEYLTMPIAVSNCDDLREFLFSVDFSAEDFELVTACEFASTPVLNTGDVSGTNVNISSISVSGVTFVNNTNTPTRPGMVNVVVLKALQTGTLTVTCGMEPIE